MTIIIKHNTKCVANDVLNVVSISSRLFFPKAKDINRDVQELKVPVTKVKTPITLKTTLYKPKSLTPSLSSTILET